MNQLETYFLGTKLPLDIYNFETGEILIPAHKKVTKTMLKKVWGQKDKVEMDPSPQRNRLHDALGTKF
jgi:DNA-directed RNA polymerase subunit beta